MKSYTILTHQFTLINISAEFQNIPRLAVQHVADRLQCGKPNGADLACFNFRKIDVRNPNPCG